MKIYILFLLNFISVLYTNADLNETIALENNNSATKVDNVTENTEVDNVTENTGVDNVTKNTDGPAEQVSKWSFLENLTTKVSAALESMDNYTLLTSEDDDDEPTSLDIEPEYDPRGTCPAETYLSVMEDYIINFTFHQTKMCLIHHKLNFLKDRKSKKIQCRPRNVTDGEEPQVLIINSTYLLSKLSLIKRDNVSNVDYCAIVMFFAPWCPFCAEVSPHYNALARAFPQVDVFAVDAIAYSNLNFRFGTVAVPNIIIFHNTKPVARFNQTERTLEKFVSFVNNVTGLVPNKTELQSEDYRGPVPTVRTEDTDYALWFSYFSILLFLCYQFSKSTHVQNAWNHIGHFFRYTEHAHID